MTLVAENRFLQSFCAVAASSVLVSGTLFLLTTTAPWTPPELAIAPSPDAVRFSLQAAASPDEAAPPASHQSEQGPTLDSGDRSYTASAGKEPDEPRTIDAATSRGEEPFAALGTPPDPETADAGEKVGRNLATGEPQTPPGRAAEGESPIEVAANAAAEASGPSAGDRSEAAAAEFAQVMTALPPRVITRDRTEGAADELAGVLATLPPRVINSERSEAAADQIAEVLADLPPAPPPPLNVKAALPFAAPAGPSASDKIKVSGLKIAALTAATPAGLPLIEAAAVVTPPPPLAQRKPETPPAPKVAVSPAPAEVSPAPQSALAAAPPRERQAVRPAPQQQTARPGGLFGNWKPMALAPADEPAPAASRPATARASTGAYAGTVWSRLARHKPRAGQRGSVSVAFAISANGALGTARIARSSGNARIDQLALATVRNAAPLPPPPSGAVSYTIRIDF